MIDPMGAETGPAYQTLGHIDALPAGTRLGEFEVKGLLGFGGFGMVYRGYDHSLERLVAIKEYMPSALVARSGANTLSARSSSDEQTFQAGLKSFIAEARLLARFDHPSLVKVYRFWEANNTAYMAMPLYEGITLKQARLQMSGPPPEDWLRVVMWSVLEALKVLHSSDALHRDVSPDNIFLQDQGPPVLLDLGAARLAVMEGNQRHTAVLKVNYAPIEQYADVNDLREGPWTDIYAVAAVIHGCICNEVPLPATFRVVRDRLPTMAKIAKTTETHFGQTYSSSFVKAIDSALSVQPGDRPASVEAFAKALRLRSVSHPQRFDWRTALGKSVSLSGPGIAPDSVVLGAWSTAKTTLPFASAQVSIAVKPTFADGVNDKVFARPLQSDRSRGWWLGGLGLTAVVVAVFAANVWTPSTLAPAPMAGVTAAAPPLVSISAPDSLQTNGVVPTTQATVSPASDLLNNPVTDPVRAALRPLLPASTLPAGPVVRVQPPAVGNARATVASAKPVDERRLSTVKTAPQAASASTHKSESGDVQQVQEVPQPSRKTHSLCPDSNLFTRPMCIYQECQKPEFKNLQVCVEDRKRWDERDKASRP